MRSSPVSAAALAALISLFAAPALATPGPDSVAVIANANVPESVALAQTYAAARDVPAAQVCPLDLPSAEDISLDDFETMLLEPFRTCLDQTPGVRDRIESVLLIRGVPLRVQVPFDGGTEVVSLAAALGLWDSANALDRIPVLDQDAGQLASCGGGRMCFAARWSNPYQGWPFESGWSTELRGVLWKPLLVTMLHARTYADAEGLLDSALAAEAMDPPTGEMLFMEGRVAARAVLDAQYDAVITRLTDLGFTATRVPFDPDLTGRTLSSFVTGTATIGDTIEGNTYLPGSVVDNLTSFGAVPANFRDDGGEQQVSISRWVEAGVAGVHGTVAEPLNNCFPGRGFTISYVEGATLAEAFHAALPFVYWMNLVLGDPMAAPYAMRPTVAVDGLSDGATLTGATPIVVSAEDPGGRGLESIVLYVDGVEVARSESSPLEHCLVTEPGERHVLAVARAADDPTGVRIWKPKGWSAATITSEMGPMECGSPDAGPMMMGGDGGVSGDAGPIPDDPEEGCACRVRPGGGAPAWWLALSAIALLRRRRLR